MKNGKIKIISKCSVRSSNWLLLRLVLEIVQWVVQLTIFTAQNNKFSTCCLYSNQSWPVALPYYIFFHLIFPWHCAFIVAITELPFHLKELDHSIVYIYKTKYLFPILWLFSIHSSIHHSQLILLFSVTCIERRITATVASCRFGATDCHHTYIRMTWTYWSTNCFQCQLVAED